MHIRTIEEDFDYQMGKVIKKFKRNFGLEGLNAEEVQDRIWEEYAEEFGKAVLDACAEYSGDELFE